MIGFLVISGAAFGLVIAVGCVMTLASLAVGDPDPLAWLKVTIGLFKEARR